MCIPSFFLGFNLGVTPPETDLPETHPVKTDLANNYTRAFPGMFCWQAFHQYPPGKSRQQV
jgi:hypothetical protein